MMKLKNDYHNTVLLKFILKFLISLRFTLINERAYGLNVLK